MVEPFWIQDKNEIKLIKGIYYHTGEILLKGIRQGDFYPIPYQQFVENINNYDNDMTYPQILT